MSGGSPGSPGDAAVDEDPNWVHRVSGIVLTACGEDQQGRLVTYNWDEVTCPNCKHELQERRKEAGQ